MPAVTAASPADACRCAATTSKMSGSSSSGIFRSGSPTSSVCRAGPTSGAPSASGGRSQPFVFLPDQFGTMGAFEPPHHEVTARHVLEVIDEHHVDGGAAGRADDRHGLRRHL